MGDRADVACAALVVRALRARVLEDDDAVFPAGLRRHHRRLGARDQLARVHRVLGAERHADRDRDLARGFERGLGKGLAQPVAEAERVGRRAGGKDDRELLAADPAHRVRPAHRRAKYVGDVPEHLVALAVPADVVHALEVVDVEHHQRDGVVGATGALELGA
jgi:hypothetical protein